MMRYIVALIALVLVVASPSFAIEATGPYFEDGKVCFSLHHADASSVHLAGDFNGWSTSELPLEDAGDGVWRICTEIPPGTYEYKFVIDGGSVWMADPGNPMTKPDPYGGNNSVIEIGKGGEVVSAEPEKRPDQPISEEFESQGKPINVAILWHQHQPSYLKDLESGEYAEPWVRLHCTKDYYDMVSILQDYPGVHFTVNLTPVLLNQIDDVITGYREGGGTDKYLRLTLKNAEDLTEEDKIFILANFFSASWPNMIDIYPVYRELRDRRIGYSEDELRQSISRYSTQDFRDIQAWFNLTWFDPDFQDGVVTLPDGREVTVMHLMAKGKGYTEADKKEIIEKQIAIMENVVPVHKMLQDKGQLEVITTPFYHPILPLLVDLELARVAVPSIELPEEGFSYPQDAADHLKKAVVLYTTLFEARPYGLWPSEGSVAQEIVPLVHGAGFTWMASDERVLERSLGRSIGTTDRYRMYWVGGQKKVAMIFRDHRLSDQIGFNYSKMDGVEAANQFISALYSIHKQLASVEGEFVVPVILDGENAWEHYDNDGKKFLHSMYSQLENADWIKTVTVSEFMRTSPPTRQIDRLWAGSWIDATFLTWIGEQEENTAWSYLARTRKHLEDRIQAGLDAEKERAAMEQIYAAEGSDWFWWYGGDQTSGNDASFDRIFRGTLANVYEILGDAKPDYLNEEIVYVPKVLSTAEGAAVEGPIAPGPPTKLDSGHLFTLEYANARTVNLAGEFNGWSTTDIPMEDPDGDGLWAVVVQDLKPGRYEYKFVINGGETWVEDPDNPMTTPDPYGGNNSVLVVE
jgi:alpha-amylase/alpha-mannosidase (GH57 family)